MDTRSAPPDRDGNVLGPAQAGMRVCADVYLRTLFDIVRATVAADPNQTIANSPANAPANGQDAARRAERSIAWSIEDASELYQVNAWGKGYFCVNTAGHLVVRPDMNAEREIDLFDVVRGTCSSTRVARSDLRDETRPSTRWRATCPAPEIALFSTISAPTDDSCPPRCCGSASTRCSARSRRRR